MSQLVLFLGCVRQLAAIKHNEHRTGHESQQTTRSKKHNQPQPKAEAGALKKYKVDG
jgi:hypothetical protein